MGQGAVWIITPTLTGNGTISANGADGQEVTGGGAGGGGRVALDIWSHAFSGKLTAYGGIGAKDPNNGCSSSNCHHKGRTHNYGFGAAGTVYSEHLKDNVSAVVASHGERRLTVFNYTASMRTHYLIASVSKEYGGLVRKANVGFLMRRKNSNSTFPDLKEVTVYGWSLILRSQKIAARRQRLVLTTIICL